MTLALVLLLCMFLGTHGFNTQLVIEPQRNFDVEKFAGEWYRIGFADESSFFAMFKNHLKISKGLLVPDASGNVNLTMWSIRPYGCAISVYLYEKTNVPGEFTYFSKRHKITKDITIVETNYTDYSLVLKYKNMNKEYTQVALYGRSSIQRPELVEKFRSFALSLGFSDEAIVIPADVVTVTYTCHYMTDRPERFDLKISKLDLLKKKRHLHLGCPWENHYRDIALVTTSSSLYIAKIWEYSRTQRGEICTIS